MCVKQVHNSTDNPRTSKKSELIRAGLLVQNKQIFMCILPDSSNYYDKY